MIRSLASAEFCIPSSSNSTSAPSATAARPPAMRSRATHVGAKAASNSGSSPTAEALWRRASTRFGPVSVPPKPRVKICGSRPKACKRVTSSITVGVLPVPPMLMLPTQITGIFSLCCAPCRHLRRASHIQIADRGDSRAAARPGLLRGLLQKAGALMAIFLCVEDSRGFPARPAGSPLRLRIRFAKPRAPFSPPCPEWTPHRRPRPAIWQR